MGKMLESPSGSGRNMPSAGRTRILPIAPFEEGEYLIKEHHFSLILKGI
jgi:hypothetical protein